MFLQDALKGFLADLDARGYSELTLLAYGRDVRVFLRYLKANDIQADLHVPTVACRRFPVYLRQRGESSTTIARRIHALRSFYSYLVKDERLDHSPFEDVQAPKRPETLPEYLEAEELERLLAATDHPQLFLSRRNRAIMAVLITTGIRRAELLALDVEDVNLEQGFMRVNGKGKRQRVLPMPPETIDILKDHLNIRLLGSRNPINFLGMARTDDVVPLAMEVRTLDLHSGQVGIGDLDPGGVDIGIELAVDLQSRGGGGAGDQVDDDLMALKGTTSPVFRDVREKPMLNLVPFAGSGRKVAYRD